MRWFVSTSTGERMTPSRIRVPHRSSSLDYLGIPVRFLTGKHGLKVLDEWCERWNRERFVPSKTTMTRCGGDFGEARRRRVLAGDRDW